MKIKRKYFISYSCNANEHFYFGNAYYFSVGSIDLNKIQDELKIVHENTTAIILYYKFLGWKICG